MKTIKDTIDEIKTFYRNVCPNELEFHTRVPDKIETINIFERDYCILPEDFKFYLTNTDFEIQIEFNYSTVSSINDTIDQLNTTNTLLDEGTFDGWVEKRYIEESNFGVKERIIKKCWWNKKWIPFALDSGGNLKCIDLDPDINGIYGQIIDVEFQDGIGPSATKYNSFTEYINYQLELLVLNKYDLDSEGLISIDSFK
jgi:cell wall assembly regulator SMI1